MKTIKLLISIILFALYLNRNKLKNLWHNYRHHNIIKYDKEII